MPSRFSSDETRGDAKLLAERLGTDFLEIPIGEIVAAFDDALAEVFAGLAPNEAEENVQARARGVLLMALSNKFGWLLVATGNKSSSRSATRRSTGTWPAASRCSRRLQDRRLAPVRHLNERAGREVIPVSIIERAPSAELRENQLDQDSLPPYAELDRVLEEYVELDRSREELMSDGFDREVVERALALIDRAEYKRRQAPPARQAAPEGVRP